MSTIDVWLTRKYWGGLGCKAVQFRCTLIIGTWPRTKTSGRLKMISLSLPCFTWKNLRRYNHMTSINCRPKPTIYAMMKQRLKQRMGPRLMIKSRRQPLTPKWLKIWTLCRRERVIRTPNQVCTPPYQRSQWSSADKVWIFREVLKQKFPLRRR